MKRNGSSMLMAVFIVVLAACGSEQAGDAPSNGGDTAATPTVDVAAGGEVYASTCLSCHGPDALGLPNLGKDLVNSQFVGSSSVDELVAFLKVGRLADDPLNTTGVAMPPKGGNPSLDDQDLADVVGYLQSLGG